MKEKLNKSSSMLRVSCRLGMRRTPEFLDELEQSLSLLAFDDATNCPLSELLQPSLWSQDQLEKKGITFPKLTNIADGKLTQ